LKDDCGDLSRLWRELLPVPLPTSIQKGQHRVAKAGRPCFSPKGLSCPDPEYSQIGENSGWALTEAQGPTEPASFFLKLGQVEHKKQTLKQQMPGQHLLESEEKTSNNNNKFSLDLLIFILMLG
jgi:hypothetical protein